LSQRFYFLLLLQAITISLFANEHQDDVILDLIHPRYEDGVLTTDEGGVLCGNHLRVQAKHICYIRKIDETPPTFSLFAKGDLLLDYYDKTLTGDSLTFDFLNNQGCITNGKTAVAPWFIGGEKIIACPDGTLIIENGYITTTEGGPCNEVILTASRIDVTPEQCLKAKGIVFKVNEIPLFYLPFFTLNTKQTSRSPFSFTAGWGGFLGSYVSLRYQFLSLRDWDFFLRADAYTGRGLGGGFETEYESSMRHESFYTRSYYAHDISIDDPKKRSRWRLQGCYDYLSDDERNWTSLIYDFLSDEEMANDYPPYKFELGTAGKTEWQLHKQTDFWIGNMTTNVRVNDFQSVNQKLPSFKMSLHPFELFDSGIIAQNLIQGSYLSYVYSDNVKDIHDFSAVRFEVRPKIYRPFFYRFFTVTPEVGFIGIAYSNSPSHHAVGQAVGEINVLCDTKLSRSFGTFKHLIEPYTHYHLYTFPRVPVDRYFVFSIEDGYNYLNYVRFGVKNSFCSPFYYLNIDIWANAFINTHHVPKSIPKGYINVDFEPGGSLCFELDSAWNFAHHQLDFINSRGEWTVNENLALAIEYRHRGRFDWRKTDFYNFVLEASRSERELLNSPLSDRRDIVMARFFYRFNPNWEAELQYRHGWNRRDQPSYTEYRLHLGKVFFEHYHIGFNYEKRESDHRVWLTFKLDPAPPESCKWIPPESSDF
jgi:hypothetical protein